MSDFNGASALKVLEERGFLQQCTDREGLERLLSDGPVRFYVGFDPTGSSLHAGHMVPMYAIAHLAMAGHKPIALVGGGTARIGDPSGKSEMRKMLTIEQIQQNAVSIGEQLRSFLERTVGDSAEINLVDNADWLAGLNYIDFLRDVGKHFSVNRMLTFEAYKQRLETGLSFIEFNYQLLQSYDFFVLNRDQGVRLQIGGDDQWGNIVAGIDLTRRLGGPELFGLTMPLVTRADGKKMGKSEKGAVFLDPEMYTPYDFFQYWRNVPDADVRKFLLIYTFLPVDEINELTSCEGQALNAAKERLAYELSRLVHGDAAADEALAGARAAFAGAGSREQMPGSEIERTRLVAGIPLVDLFVETGLCASKSEVRRLIKQGGAKINDSKINDPEAVVSEDSLSGSEAEMVLRAGKKRVHRLTVV
ncbi:tyrosine--tRNA ligase [Spirochaeta dissipatitropha]